MKKLIWILLILLSVTISELWAQKSTATKEKTLNQQEAMEKSFEQLFEMQRRMMQEMMKSMQGAGPGGGRDMDKLIQQLRQGVMGDDADLGDNGVFASRWEEKGKERHLIITPSSPDDKLDLDVNKDRVKISGKIEEKIENNGPNGKSYSRSVQSFSSSISIPEELDGEKVQMETVGKDIVIKFPYRSGKEAAKKEAPKKKTDSYLKPIPANPNDETI